jgi:hypothetical protein
VGLTTALGVLRSLASDGTLYVTDTVNSRIARVPDALNRTSPVDAGAASATVSSGAPLDVLR